MRRNKISTFFSIRDSLSSFQQAFIDLYVAPSFRKKRRQDESPINYITFARKTHLWKKLEGTKKHKRKFRQLSGQACFFALQNKSFSCRVINYETLSLVASPDNLVTVLSVDNHLVVYSWRRVHPAECRNAVGMSSGYDQRESQVSFRQIQVFRRHDNGIGELIVLGESKYK